MERGIRMAEMQTFECAICGKIHHSLKDRIACETACLKEQEYLSKDANMKAECERIDKAVVKLVEDYIKINMDIDKFYKTYGEDAQLKTKDLKDEMDDEFYSVVYDLINFIF